MIKFNKTSIFVVFIFSVVGIYFVSNKVYIYQTFSSVIGSFNCELSHLESNGFFCETNRDWIRRKKLFHLQHNRNQFRDSPYLFFQDNYEPTFSCRFEQRLGINGDGGKWICDVYKLKHLNSCLIYSFGSNGEFSFENETKHALPNCEIHTFDVRDFNCTDICTFHQVKVGDGSNGTKTLRMIMSDLNHRNRYLDILKMDVEGSEYEFFDDLINTTNQLSKNIHQILVEIHLGRIMRTENNVTIYDYKKIHRLFQFFHEKHYVIFHKEVNLFNPYHVFEFSLIRMNERFFRMRNSSNGTEYLPTTAKRQRYSV